LAAPTRILLLGRRERLLVGGWAAQAPALAALLARGTPFEATASDEPALAAAFDFPTIDDAAPVAALTRAIDAGDAEGACWVRADPAYVRADATCARMLAIGDFEVGQADAAAAVALLAPLFGDAGLAFDAPHPHRWYLRLPVGGEWPRFPHPRSVLGDDLSLHLPRGAEARRFVRLLNDAQVLLHHAEFNRARLARGLPPINSLWFWGAGVVPSRITARAARVATDDPVLLGALRLAGRGPVDYAIAAPAGPGDSVVDLRRLDDPALLDRDWLAADLTALKRGQLGALRLVFADGSGVVVNRRQAWRWWLRRPA
jgi:hypothetical protein